ncbi:MAG: hypothetical protein A3H35_09620 [Betaproteobacteria bacterium RIFCSPLOWO2_02_FULL_62_17]|nr:MAG: hypothetical protein A3H35_09620 [Betaproteobacteria bacterium RIFCSPLOWO2_02_FULL_62_17]
MRYAEQDDARPGKSFADIAPERQSALQSAMDGLSDAMVVEDSVVHKQAQHAYAIPDRDVFDKHAANRDWEHVFAMLRRQVPCQASIAAAVSTQT